jgi:tetratricopeptide (TPR) repeat protein
MSGSTENAAAPVVATAVGISLAHIQTFIDTVCGGRVGLADLSVRDVCEMHVVPATANAGVSYVEYLRRSTSANSNRPTSFSHKLFAALTSRRQQPDTALATKTASTYLCYSWACKFLDVVDCLELLAKSNKNVAGKDGDDETNPGEFTVWMDLFCFNQHHSSKSDDSEENGHNTDLPAEIQTIIRTIGSVSMVFTDIQQLQTFNLSLILSNQVSDESSVCVFTRTWCLFELFVASICGCRCKCLFPSTELYTEFAELFSPSAQQNNLPSVRAMLIAYLSLFNSACYVPSDRRILLQSALDLAGTAGSIDDEPSYTEINKRIANYIMQAVAHNVTAPAVNLSALAQHTQGGHSLSPKHSTGPYNQLLQVDVDEAEEGGRNTTNHSLSPSLTAEEMRISVSPNTGAALEVAKQLVAEHRFADADKLFNETLEKLEDRRKSRRLNSGQSSPYTNLDDIHLSHADDERPSQGPATKEQLERLIVLRDCIEFYKELHSYIENNPTITYDNSTQANRKPLASVCSKHKLESVCREYFICCRRYLSPDEDTITEAANELAEILNSQEKYSQAEPLYIFCLHSLRRKYAAVDAYNKHHSLNSGAFNVMDHSELVEFTEGLILYYEDRHKYWSAVELLDDICSALREKIYDECRNIEEFLANYSNLDGDKKDLATKLLAYLSQQATLYGYLAGEGESSAGTSKDTQTKSAAHANCISVFKEAFKLTQLLYGADHNETLAAMEDLGSAYLQCGRLQESEEVMNACLQGRMRRTKASKTSHVADKKEIELMELATMNDLAILYDNMENYNRAKELYEECIERRKMLLGMNKFSITFCFVDDWVAYYRRESPGCYVVDVESLQLICGHGQYSH